MSLVTTSSPPSSSSEALPSVYASDSNTALPSDLDDTPSLVQELQEATLVLPMPVWAEEVAVSMIVPEDSPADGVFNLITEVKIEESTVPLNVVQRSGLMSGPLIASSVKQINVTQGGYQYNNRKNYSTDNEELQFQAFDSRLPPRPLTNSGQNDRFSVAIGETADFRDSAYPCLPSSQAQSNKGKRPREEHNLTSSNYKGKAKSDCHKTWISSSEALINGREVSGEQEEEESALESSPELDYSTESEEERQDLSNYSYPTISRNEEYRPIKQRIILRQLANKDTTEGQQLNTAHYHYSDHMLSTPKDTVSSYNEAEVRASFAPWLHPAFQQELDPFVPHIPTQELML
jgi:hypothetical protein